MSPYETIILEDLERLLQEIEGYGNTLRTYRWGTLRPLHEWINKNTMKEETFDTTLTRQQKAIEKEVKGVWKRLLNLEVLLIREWNGMAVEPVRHAKIVDVKSGEKTFFQVRSLDGNFFGADDGKSPVQEITVELFQFELKGGLKAIPPVTELRKTAYQQVGAHIENLVNADIIKAKEKIGALAREIESYEKKIKADEEKKKEYEQIASKKPESVGIKDIEKMLAEIKAHSMVEDAYISDEENIIVLTKNLKPLDFKTDKVLPGDLGRYTFRYGLKENTVRIANRDFEYEGHDHPHIQRDKQRVCWGDNSDEIEDMKSRGDYFMLTDFIITFLSIFPQEHGEPYCDYEDWMECKTKRKSNLYMEGKL